MILLKIKKKGSEKKMSKVGLVEHVKVIPWDLWETKEGDKDIMRVLMDYAHHPWKFSYGINDAE